MKDGATLIVLSLVLLYPASYAALRLTHVMTHSSFWACTSRSAPKSGVAGPRVLELVYQPLIYVETSLPRSFQPP